MDLNQHIFDQDKNHFYDVDGFGHLSQTARYYISESLYHGAEVPALKGNGKRKLEKHRLEIGYSWLLILHSGTLPAASI